jgi:predicted dehydrogenase
MERRNFIKKAALGSAVIASSNYVNAFGAQQKIKVGLIGAGWYGMVISKAALKVGGVDIVAICDVDSGHLNSSADELEKLQGTRPKTFKNYQELLDVKGLEAVFIGTPPHWHALQFIAACERGLHIYCEKPLSYDICEGLAMVKAARKAGNIVQVGFQRRQSGAFVKAKELIATGAIGNIHQISAQINYIPGPQDTTIQPPPASLDWEEWCGPAPRLEYRPSIAHKAWRLEKEYHY